MKAFMINCTLKRNPDFSNTGALAEKAAAQFKELGIETEIVRLNDYKVLTGNSSDEGEGDQWPVLLEKIKSCNIFIIATPIWMGHLASTSQKVIERLDAIFRDENLSSKENGQYMPYNKVGGCLITGNEDGAHSCAAQVLWSLQEVGFTIPPNVNAYWVGMAGGEKDYVEAGGERYLYTNKSLRYMTANLAFMAGLLAENPFTTNLLEEDKKAVAESDKEGE
ncbi:flavodoxin family protein [Mucilaginibacter sabulilitoris]|uniref:Flavodoxin family protein n=1 Tax=Mucilaginibacter sabulilitoris TaxID=1173583 RepID=A0ABZ0TFS3_9SPHI|nr:flavodoxin family protein [Mucilaginibacter sabulilitoris]WPU91614.1 flavodoxin family protein [Mucilaginibacter sabulilitoris]